MKPFETVAIVGVGLIGGSIGMALRSRNLARNVTGIARRQSTLRTARRRGAITSGTTDLARGVADAQMIVVCTPVESIAAIVTEAVQHSPDHALITDAGSTKGQIVAQLNGELPKGTRFVGSHPMAGSEQKGPDHADAELFEGRTVIVTPTRRTPRVDLQEVHAFWSAIGAKVVEMSPSRHDQCVAAVSHLPHVVAAALAASTTDAQLPYAATGWLDTTRIAAGDVGLWMEILRSNRSHVLKSLRRFEKLCSDLGDSLENEDERKLERTLSDAKRKRDSMNARR